MINIYINICFHFDLVLSKYEWHEMQNPILKLIEQFAVHTLPKSYSNIGQIKINDDFMDVYCKFKEGSLWFIVIDNKKAEYEDINID